MTIEGDFGDWTPITVHLTGEISARDRTRPYKGAMFAAYPGDIVFSKIDARSGAIGMLPPEIGKAVVTVEFPVFTADPTRLKGEFAKLVLRTGGFIEALRRRASGTSGRKRITPEAFQDLCIPLPPLGEQRAMVSAHCTAMDRAADLEREADQTEARAMEAFETALGFVPLAPVPDRPIFASSFKDLDRWSHEAVLLRMVEGCTDLTSPYPTVRLSDVVSDLENGWSPKCHQRPAEENEWGVLKLGAVSFGVFDANENKALPLHLTPRPFLEVTAGQLLISRANITRLVGATALVCETRQKLMLCDKIFRVVPREPATIALTFLSEVLRVSSVRRQIEANVTGTSPTMKNISKPALMSLTFPLPPKNEQADMVKALTGARAAAASLRRKAEKMRATAWAEFERAVYEAESNASTAKI